MTWSMADGCFPWWKVDTRIANAWTWFKLTLNWSCNIRALSSHMLASVSSLLKMIFWFKCQNNQKDVRIPRTTNIIRSFFLHFPAPLGGLWACCCCFCCSSSCSCWATGCDGTISFFLFLQSFKRIPGILQLSITPTRSNQHPFTIQKDKLSQWSFDWTPSALLCKMFCLCQTNKKKKTVTLIALFMDIWIWHSPIHLALSASNFSKEYIYIDDWHYLIMEKGWRGIKSQFHLIFLLDKCHFTSCSISMLNCDVCIILTVQFTTKTINFIISLIKSTRI